MIINKPSGRFINYLTQEHKFCGGVGANAGARVGAPGFAMSVGPLCNRREEGRRGWRMRSLTKREQPRALIFSIADASVRFGRVGLHISVQFADNTSACSSTVSVAFSCMSGGYPYLRRIRLTKTLKWARIFSRTVQSMVVFRWTVATSPRAVILIPQTREKNLSS